MAVTGIAFCGKGGVGKSTIVANLAAAMVEAGFNVVRVSFSYEPDGLDGRASDQRDSDVQNEMPPGLAVRHGFKGVTHLHAPQDLFLNGADGGDAWLSLVQRLSAQEPSFVLYDLPADPVRYDLNPLLAALGIQQVLVVTTADFKSLSVANAILAGLVEKGQGGRLPIVGLIANGIGNSFDDVLVGDFAASTATSSIGRIPRSLMVTQCELQGKTVIEAAPLSNQSYFYRRLSNHIVDLAQARLSPKQPVPMTRIELQSWAQKWGDRLYALENGLVNEGEAI